MRDVAGATFAVEVEENEVGAVTEKLVAAVVVAIVTRFA